MTTKTAPVPVTTLGKLIQLVETGKADAAMLQLLAKVATQEKEDIRKSAWHEAMRACQAEMSPVSKDAKNDQTRSKYVTLAALDEALRPTYVKHGFTCVFKTCPNAPEDEVMVKLEVTHEAGHTESFHVSMPADGKGIKGTTMMTRTHAAASAVSYGRRYLLTMAFNIATSDDDGNAAGVRPNAPAQPIAGPKVSRSEGDELVALADEVKADKRLLCIYLEGRFKTPIGSLYDVPQTKFLEVKQQLARKGAQSANQ